MHDEEFAVLLGQFIFACYSRQVLSIIVDSLHQFCENNGCRDLYERVMLEIGLIEHYAISSSQEPVVKASQVLNVK
jgi:hypothetical protein